MLVEAFGSARVLEGPSALTSRTPHRARDETGMIYGSQWRSQNAVIKIILQRPACHGQDPCGALFSFPEMCFSLVDASRTSPLNVVGQLLTKCTTHPFREHVCRLVLPSRGKHRHVSILNSFLDPPTCALHVFIRLNPCRALTPLAEPLSDRTS